MIKRCSRLICLLPVAIFAVAARADAPSTGPTIAAEVRDERAIFRWPDAVAEPVQLALFGAALSYAGARLGRPRT